MVPAVLVNNSSGLVLIGQIPDAVAIYQRSVLQGCSCCRAYRSEGTDIKILSVLPVARHPEINSRESRAGQCHIKFYSSISKNMILQKDLVIFPVFIHHCGNIPVLRKLNSRTIIFPKSRLHRNFYFLGSDPGNIIKCMNEEEYFLNHAREICFTGTKRMPD